MMFSCNMVETGITTSLCECKKLPPQSFEKVFPQTRIVSSCSCTAQPLVEHSQETSTAPWCSLPAVSLSGFLPSKLQPPWCLQMFSFAPKSGAFRPHAMDCSFLQGRNPRPYLISPPVSRVLLPHVSMC